MASLPIRSAAAHSCNWPQAPLRCAATTILIFRNGTGQRVVSGGRKMGLEGIVSKRLGSRYRSGRTKDWLKFKNPDAPAVRLHRPTPQREESSCQLGAVHTR